MVKNVSVNLPRFLFYSIRVNDLLTGLFSHPCQYLPGIFGIPGGIPYP